MNWVNIVVDVLTTLVIVIPLVAKLVEYVQKAIKEKNWNKLLNLVMEFMAEAETKFETGAEKKDYVIMCIKACSDTLNYDINMDQVSELIDNLCAMSKVVNAPTETDEE
jgi:hypothetical protein